MKKAIGTIIGVLVVAAMVLLLAGNRKKTVEQTSSAQAAGREEVVTVHTVHSEESAREFTSNGIAQPFSELNFVSEVSGRVIEICADKGSRVSKGTPLLKIDAELLEADYEAALAARDALKKDEERFTRSYEAGGISSQQLDNIRTQLVAAQSRLTVSRWKLDNAVIKAPVSGTVNNRFVETGALIAPNVPLFEIVDDSRIKVICNVPQSRVRLISDGQKVSAVSSQSSGTAFTGTVRNIGIKTDRGLNYPVEVVFDRNPDLRVGMYLKVRFAGDRTSTGIFIPRKAVVGSVLAAKVYVVKDGRAEGREVELGDISGDRIEILSGLEEGDRIVIAGLMNISDGTVVKIVDEQ